MSKSELETMIDQVQESIKALDSEPDTPERQIELTSLIKTRDELLQEFWQLEH